MKRFHLGPLAIDPAEYGSQGNAVLGIRGSGKSYTATEIGEQLFDAGVPWISFDPTGIWRFIRVPGKGKGYPIVVAGGKDADLPLTVAGTPALVRAAMESGISLVFDLHGAMLSKADWRRVITSAVRTLLQENAPHGLRHVFIEEAAEFVPQRPIDWDVYAEVERLARVGGNSRLGYTLINQRSQEVNKAVLELCENIFLHRQRGKNALENLDKWMEVAGAMEREAIIKSMPDLPTGQCWAWIGGDKPRPPQLITVPPKNSFHPDRRVMRGEAIKTRRKPVDVGQFVTGMKGELAKIVEEAKANDVPTLKGKILELERKLAARPATETVTVNAKAEQLEAAYQRGWKAHARENGKAMRRVQTMAANTAKALAEIEDTVAGLKSAANGLVEELKAVPEMPADVAPALTVAPPSAPARPAGTPSRGPAAPALPAGGQPAEGLSRPQQRILDALAWLEMVGVAQADRVRAAFLADQSHRSSGYEKNVSTLSGRGLISYPAAGFLQLTEAGRQAANPPAAPPTTAELHRSIASKVSGPQWALLEQLIAVYPGALTREDLAKAADVSAASSGFEKNVSTLSGLGFVTYPVKGSVAALPILFVE